MLAVIGRTKRHGNSYWWLLESS